MFTGLIADVGEIMELRQAGKGAVMWIRTGFDLSTVELGASIAVDGVCLTAEEFKGDRFRVTAGIETMNRTSLGGFKPGRTVHLEQALRLGDRLGGHIVQGHVDGVGRVRTQSREQESWVFWIEAPTELSRFMVEKGSVAVDGVSLTVNEISGDAFRINIIPHTVEHTHVAAWRAGVQVNLEVDVLARYVERLLQGRPSGGLTMSRLEELGYGTTKR